MEAFYGYMSQLMLRFSVSIKESAFSCIRNKKIFLVDRKVALSEKVQYETGYIRTVNGIGTN